MTQINRSSDELDGFYAVKTAAGLVDVKFLLRNEGDASATEVCAEHLALNKAIADGKAVPLDFGDLRFKRAN